MIKKYTTTEYALVCDECGTETLSDISAQEMLRDAKEKGWEVHNKCFEQIGGVCPSCQKAAQAGEGER